MSRVRVGVDVGGTFTDVVSIDERGTISYAKVPSTPEDQSIGVISGVTRLLKRLEWLPSDVEVFVHGTTVATNTLLERKGARVGLLTTQGFRDVPHIGRQSRPHLYDLHVRRPAPLVARRFRREIAERTLYTGDVEIPVNVSEVQSIVRDFLASGIEAIAICLLHSYANPTNERVTAEAARSAAPDVPVSVSAEILPEIREFERMNTTMLNAYLQPSVGRYLARLAEHIQKSGMPARLLVMRSNGGAANVTHARAQAVQMLLSGPAGGVLGGALLSEVTGLRNCITADVGGTSFDVAVLEDGRPTIETEGAVEGYPIKFPHISIHTVGAGGGSIAWLDRAGALRVGPQSAGARPGPICYGQGGIAPTVTDAHVVLGRLRALLDGELALDAEAARRGLHRELGRPLGISPEETSDGILRVVTAAMTRAIRVMTVERGIDPRKFSLVAFGGAGPLHASDLARGLGIGEIVIPVAPGNFSALGLLATPIREDRVRTFRARINTVDGTTLQAIYSALAQEAITALRGEAGESDSIRCERGADLRYVGQAYELTVRAPDDVTDASLHALATAFHRAHERTYGFSKPEDPVEIVNVRLAAFVDLERPGWAIERGDGAGEVPASRRPVWFDGRWVESMIVHRPDLRPGHQVAGPAVIEEHGATSVLAPGDVAVVDGWGNLRISVAQATPLDTRSTV